MVAASRAHRSELCCKDERSRESPGFDRGRKDCMVCSRCLKDRWRPFINGSMRFQQFYQTRPHKNRTPCLELGRLAKAAPGAPTSDTEASVRRRAAPGRGGKGTLRRAGAGSGGRAGSHVVEDATVRRRGRRLSGLDGLGGAASLAEEAADSPGRRQ